MKDLAIQMVSQLTNHQYPYLPSPQPHDILHTQPSTYSYIAFHHSYPPQPTPYFPLTNMSTTVPTPYTPPSCIPPQCIQGVTPLLTPN